MPACHDPRPQPPCVSLMPRGLRLTQEGISPAYLVLGGVWVVPGVAAPPALAPQAEAVEDEPLPAPGARVTGQPGQPQPITDGSYLGQPEPVGSEGVLETPGPEPVRPAPAQVLFIHSHIPFLTLSLPRTTYCNTDRVRRSLKIVSLKIVSLKIVSLKIVSLKIVSLKIVSLKIVSLKIVCRSDPSSCGARNGAVGRPGGRFHAVRPRMGHPSRGAPKRLQQRT